MIASAPLLAMSLALAMQAGPNPATGGMTGVPEELRNRPPRTNSVPAPATRDAARLTQCLALVASDPQAALNSAQRWRDGAQDTLELARTSHCAGMALVELGRFGEARVALEMASDEAPLDQAAYRARLAAMAGNAALAAGDAEGALPLLAGAVETARPTADAALSAGLMLDQARALVTLGRAADATTLLAAAREADPASGEAWLLSATLARRENRLGEAQGMIEQAATRDPRNPAIGLEAGVIAALAGRDEAAQASFAAVVAMDEDSAEAETARGYLAQLSGQSRP